MRLAIKLCLAVALALVFVLTAQALLHVRQIDALQEREIRDDVLILARVLASATIEIWQTQGEARARAFIAAEAIDERQLGTTLRLLTDDELDMLTDDLSRPLVERTSGERGWRIIAVTPLRIEQRLVAAIEIERRLPGERNYFMSLLWTQLITTVIAALAAGLTAFVLSFLMVGRPIQQLSELAHSVTSGNYSLRTDLAQRDEIGRLAQDLNEMSEQLERSKQKINNERSARTAALEQLRHADRLSTVGKLASSMAHELGTPLNVVSGRAMMIASDDEVPEAAREDAEIIAEQSTRMTQIIRELLDFSRSKPLARTDIRIGDVVEHAISLIEPVCEKKRVTLAARGFLDTIAHIDAGKLLQVLTNLMMNAIQAMPDGGPITLSVKHEQLLEPEDRHAQTDNYVAIEIQDSGVGIAPEHLNNIFKAFFTTKRQGIGTGLGLSICHGIVREHGGFIKVESEVGRGTRFTVFLPKRGEA